MDNKEFLDLRVELKELKEKNAYHYISYLFFAHILKRQFPNITKYSSFQYNYRLKNLRSDSQALSVIYNNLYKEDSFSYFFNNSLNDIIDFDLKDIIIEEIKEYVIKKKMHDVNLENLSKRFLSFPLLNTLILTPFVLGYLFEDESNISSINFNFYNEEVNNLMSIYFDVKMIKYEIVTNRTNTSKYYVYQNLFVFPPYRNTTYNRELPFLDKKSDLLNDSLEWGIIDFLFTKMDSKSNLVFITQLGILNKLSDEAKKKKLFLSNRISHIIELPKLSFFSSSLALLYLKEKSKETKGINASKFAQNLRRGVDLDSEKIIRAINGQIDDTLFIFDKEYLDSNNYDLTPNRLASRTKSDFINPIALKEVTTKIFRGFQIPSVMLDQYASENPTKIKLLTLSDIDNGIIIKDSMQSLNGIDKAMEHYILKNNDLVISCKGKSFKTAVVEVPYGETYISTGSIIVIRAKENILDATYLKIFLDSSIGIESLKRIQTGASILSLNPSKLNGVIIPLPHYSKQILISSSYKYKLQNIKEVNDVAKSMKDEMDKKYDKNFLSLIN